MTELTDRIHEATVNGKGEVSMEKHEMLTFFLHTYVDLHRHSGTPDSQGFV